LGSFYGSGDWSEGFIEKALNEVSKNNLSYILNAGNEAAKPYLIFKLVCQKLYTSL
jgi:hypothetical protein